MGLPSGREHNKACLIFRKEVFLSERSYQFVLSAPK